MDFIEISVEYHAVFNGAGSTEELLDLFQVSTLQRFLLTRNAIRSMMVFLYMKTTKKNRRIPFLLIL